MRFWMRPKEGEFPRSLIYVLPKLSDRQTRGLFGDLY